MRRLLSLAVLTVVLAGCACNPPMLSGLDVPTRPQQASLWCWAASGEMTMAFFGHGVAECTQANNRFGLTTCCTNNSGGCNNGGWPEYTKYGFTSSHTSDTALTWAQVREQIYCKKKPVAFSWHWTGGGGHMMVLKGYVTLGGINYVDTNDPEPYTDLTHPDGGTEVIMTYARYVSDTGHTHWDDYYDITYVGTGTH
jgi:hypothetical protein